jgi:hypothetical protein
MRISLALVLMTSLAACSGAPAATAPLDGSQGPDDGGDGGDGGLPLPSRGFQLVSPAVEVAPRTQVTFCYYFRTPNTTDLAIKRWASRMTAGSHHMMVYFTQADQQTPGTLTTSRCGFAINGIGPVWAYGAQDRDHESVLPADDGNGVPVAQPVKASQAGFVLMHFMNTTAAPIRAHVELNAYAHDDGVQVTPAAPFVAYNTRIDVPAAVSAVAPTTGVVSGSCAVASDARFFLATTHTHKQGVRAFIKDGDAMVFNSAGWEHPGEQRWSAAPFHTFASGKLSYQCEYSNPNNYRLQAGDSMTMEEACMAIGYYFPATTTTGHYCQNSVIVY